MISGSTLREWLGCLRAADAGSDKLRNRWRNEMVPDFLAACSLAFEAGDYECIAGCMGWLQSDAGRTFARNVSYGQAGWHRLWLECILATALKLADGHWGSGGIPHGVIKSIEQSFASALNSRKFPIFKEGATVPENWEVDALKSAFPSGFWRNMLECLQRPGLVREQASRTRAALKEWQMRSRLPHVRVTFPLVDLKEKAPRPWVIAQFYLELLETGSGDVFLAPGQLLQRHIGCDFAANFTHAAGEASKLVRKRDRLRDVRVYIKPLRPDDEVCLSVIGGPSAGGALAVGLWSLWEGRPVDPGMLISFALTEDVNSPSDGGCHEVGGAVSKAEGCIYGGLRDFLVSEAQPGELEDWADSLGLNRASGFEIRRAATVQQAVGIASRIAGELEKYYKDLIERMDRLPWRLPGGKEATVAETAVPIVVLKEVKKVRKVPGDGNPEEEHDRVTFHGDIEEARLYEESTEAREEAKWESELKNVRSLVIKGAPGGGKTFLTKWTAVHLARGGLEGLKEGKSLDELPVPVLLELPKTAEKANAALIGSIAMKGNIEIFEDSDTGSTSPAAALRDLLSLSFEYSPAFPGWLMERLRESDGSWLILDALDQVPPEHHSALEEWLGNVESKGWRCRKVVTCRAADYDSYARRILPWGKVTEYELAPFKRSGIMKFIDSWFGKDDAKGAELKGLLAGSHPLLHSCRTPLVSAMVCEAHHDNGIKPGIRSGELFGLVLRNRLGRPWQKNAPRMKPSELDRRLWLLERAVFPLFQKNPADNRFLSLGLDEELQKGINERNWSYFPDKLTDEFIASGILIENKANVRNEPEVEVSFCHRLFVEYLAARGLVREIREKRIKLDYVFKKSWHPAWRQVIVFLAGELDDPAPLLKELTDESNDDLFRHRLALAGHCICESPEGLADKRNWATKISKCTFHLWVDAISGFTIRALLHINSAITTLVQSNKPILFELCNYLRIGANREEAMEVVGGMGEVVAQPDILNALLRALHDDVWYVRSSAAIALMSMSETAARHPGIVDALLELALRDDNADVSCRAGDAVGRMGEAAARPDIIIALLRSLHDNDLHVRGKAAGVLGRMGEAAARPDIINELLRSLHDDDLHVRCEAAEALGRMGEAGARPDTINALLRSLHETDFFVRSKAAEALGRMGEAAAHLGAIDALQEVLYEKVIETPEDAAAHFSLLGFAVTPPDISNHVIQTLSHEHSEMRRKAAVALGRMSKTTSRHSGIVDALLEMALHDPLCGFSSIVGEKLGQMGDASARQYIFDALLRSLHDNDLHIRGKAADALGGMGEAAARPDILNALRRALHDDDSTVRGSAAVALGRMGDAAAKPDIINALRRALHDDDWYVRCNAAHALGKMGAAAARPDILNALLRALHDDNSFVRGDAADALGGMGAAAARPDILNALLQALYNKPMCLRAVDALGQMGAAAAQYPGVIQVLLQTLPDYDDLEERLRVTKALWRMMATGIRIFRQESSKEIIIKTTAELAGEAEGGSHA